MSNVNKIPSANIHPGHHLGPISDTKDDMTEDEKAGKAQDVQQQVEEITSWWRKMAEADADRTGPKAVAYGAADLDIMGRAMVSLGGGLWEGATDQERAEIGREMATAFYLLGKCARMFGAFEQGRRPQDDDWFDATVYCVMGRRIRETGRWV